MAAGASIHSDSFAEFKSAFESLSEERQEQLSEADILYTDGSVNAELDDLKLIHDIKFAAPWGQGFPEPLFDDVFTVVDQRLVGDIHLKLRLRKEGAGHQTIDGICFRFLTSPGAPCPNFDRIHAAYRVDINEYAGRIKPQVIIEYLEAV